MSQNRKIRQGDDEPGIIHCCVGRITTNHNHLITKLGPPRHVEALSGDNKVTTEWIIQFGDDFFSVHDYKESIYYGEGGGNLALEEIRSSRDITWSIGGKHGSDPEEFIKYLEGGIM